MTFGTPRIMASPIIDSVAECRSGVYDRRELSFFFSLDLTARILRDDKVNKYRQYRNPREWRQRHRSSRRFGWPGSAWKILAILYAPIIRSFFFPIHSGPRYANDQDFPSADVECHVQECHYVFLYYFGPRVVVDINLRYHFIIIFARKINY